jgi:rhodanese-related sulfurtransferase
MIKTENPKHQAFTLPGINHIDSFGAADAVANHNAIIVDVREQEELDIIKFDTTEVIQMPLSIIAEKFEELPKDRPLIIACNNGIRSVKVVNLLNYQGFTNAINLDGGITQWHRDGLPLILRQDLVDAGESCGSHDQTGGCGGCSCGC